MAGTRLGKRERMLRKSAIEAGKAHLRSVVAANLAAPLPDKSLLTHGGASDSVTRLMGATHTGFRSNLHPSRDKMAGARDKHVLAVTGQSVGRVALRKGWQKQAPLPTDHATLRALERGDKVKPVEPSDLPERPMYATGPTVQRFSKTK